MKDQPRLEFGEPKKCCHGYTGKCYLCNGLQELADLEAQLAEAKEENLALRSALKVAEALCQDGMVSFSLLTKERLAAVERVLREAGQ